MTKEYSRAQRIAKEIKKEIAIILQRNIQDPRIDMTTVSNVEVSRDLAYAKVFVTFLNNNSSEKNRKNILILQEAVGFIRRLLAKAMRLRTIPELTFTYDNSLLEGIRITNLVSKVIKKDCLHYD